MYAGVPVALAGARAVTVAYKLLLCGCGILLWTCLWANRVLQVRSIVFITAAISLYLHREWITTYILSVSWLHGVQTEITSYYSAHPKQFRCIYLNKFKTSAVKRQPNTWLIDEKKFRNKSKNVSLYLFISMLCVSELRVWFLFVQNVCCL